MIQDKDNNRHYIADEGKIFQRISNGFADIEEPYIVGNELILGQILINNRGEKLEHPIDDKIEYYAEVEIPIINKYKQ